MHIFSKLWNCGEFTKLMPEKESRNIGDHKLWNKKMQESPVHTTKRLLGWWLLYTQIPLNIHYHLTEVLKLHSTTIEIVSQSSAKAATQVRTCRWMKIRLRTQGPRMELNKRSLPKPTTTSGWKLIPHRSKTSMN